MNAPRVLVAGVGNIFFGDDAFGCEVVARLARRTLPEGVRVKDFGIRGMDLAYALLDPYELVVLVDAVPRGGPPGSLYVIEPTAEELGAADPATQLDTHGMHPVKVLQMANSLGARIQRLLIVGCEPAPLEVENDIAAGLSPAVEAVVDEAVRLVEALVAENLARRNLTPVN